jgi:hypothetical protein
MTARRARKVLMIARLALRAALTAVLVMTLAGCGPVHSKAAAPPSAPGIPTHALAPRTLVNAIPDDKAGAFHFSVTGGDRKMTGVLDLPKSTAEFHVVHGSSVDETIRVLGRRAWVKFTGDKYRLQGEWLTIKYSQHPPFWYAQQSDPAFVATVLGFGSDIRETSPGHYSGTTDLNATHPDSLLNGDRLEALGHQAQSLPFTAAVDAAGRFASLSVKIPAVPGFPATTYQVNYDGYGTTADPTEPPAADQAAAPAGVYRMFAQMAWPGPAI